MEWTQLSWSVEDSPASPSPSRAAGAGQTTRAGSGPRFSDAFAWWDPDSCSWKTCQGSLLPDSERLPPDWPSSGTTSSGTAYRRPPLVPRTSVTDSSLWPTAVAHDDNKTPEAHLAMKARMPGGPRQTITSLNVMVKAVDRGLWPTPTAKDADASGSRNLPGSKAHPGVSLTDAVRSGNSTTPRWPTPKSSPSGPDYARQDRSRRPDSGGDDLATAVARWPTPLMSDASGGPRARPEDSNARPLKEAVWMGGGGGSLNPTWVEWLMGFPLGWTDSEHSETP